MPWPWGLLNWVQDPAGSVMLSKLSGDLVRCRMPYPMANWRQERTRNEFLIEAMEVTLQANDVFIVPAEKWGKPARAFYTWLETQEAEADGG